MGTVTERVTGPPKALRPPGLRLSARAFGLAGWLAVLFAVLLASVAIGTKDIPLPTVLDALVDHDGNSPDQALVRELRLPRTGLGLVTGAALGLAGALVQALTRNPLADPGILSTTPDVSYEKVAALNPDLILATGDYAIGDHYAQLSKIAPTVAARKSAAEDSWQTREKQIGSALGRSEDAERQIGIAEAAIPASAARHSGLKGKTFSASFGYSPTQIATLASPKDFAVKFLEALGPKVTPSLAGTEKTATKVQPGILSPEQAEKLSADLVVIGFNSPQVR